MTINGIDISVYGATLLSKKITNHDVVQVFNWLDGAAMPVFTRNEQRFKDIALTFLIESSSEAATEGYFSALMLAMKDCIILFNELTKYFACHFDGKVEPKKLTARAWLVEIDLLCHKTYLSEVVITANGISSKSITSTGAIPSPCLITVTPSVAIAEYTISGLSSTSIKIKNLTANKAHVIDGYLFRYLKDGGNDITNFDAFEWPVLPIGTTNVTFSHTTANVTIQYYPLFN